MGIFQAAKSNRREVGYGRAFYWGRKPCQKGLHGMWVMGGAFQFGIHLGCRHFQDSCCSRPKKRVITSFMWLTYWRVMADDAISQNFRTDFPQGRRWHWRKSLSQEIKEDELIWHYSMNGSFTIKTCYQMLKQVMYAKSIHQFKQEYNHFHLFIMLFMVKFL